MSEEGQEEVDAIQPDAEGKIPPNKEGKYPEVVPWNQYVGIKEKLGKEKKELQEKVKSLEEIAKGAISGEAYQKLTDEFEALKSEHQKTADELKGVKDSKASEMRTNLVKRGVPEEEVNDLGEKELVTLSKALDSFKPKPDLGSGGGSGVLRGTPMDLARRAYEESTK